jgi:hypothetical protein
LDKAGAIHRNTSNSKLQVKDILQNRECSVQVWLTHLQHALQHTERLLTMLQDHSLRRNRAVALLSLRLTSLKKRIADPI